MLDDAANVIQRRFGQIGIAIAREYRLAGLPDGLVHMHARTIIAIDRLRHEGRGLAVAMGDIMHAVFVDLHEVSLLHQRAELRAKFMLGLRHFMVMLFDRQAHLTHGGEHLGAQILFAIHRRHREITTLHNRAMAHIAFRIVLHIRTGAFDAIQRVMAEIATRAELHIVEHEEFRFRAKEGGVAQAGGLQIFFGLLRGGARVAVVALAGGGLINVAEKDHLRLGREGIHHGGGRIRHQDHV